jgi:urease accessory protein
MNSDVLLVACRDRQPRIECGGAVTARRTEPDTVHLVSKAATPLGGDAINIRVVVEAGDLDVDPQPTVVAAASRHFTSTRLELTGSGRIRLRERVQIGRSDERQGFWSGSLYADVDGSPLLRHRIELGNGSVADDELGAPLACVSELHYPESGADTAGVLLALAGGGCLSTWQGHRL